MNARSAADLFVCATLADVPSIEFRTQTQTGSNAETNGAQLSPGAGERQWLSPAAE